MFTDYDRNILVQCYKAQKEAYQEVINVLNKAIPVLWKFDGKILNVKLTRAMDEAIPEATVRVKTGYGTTMQLELWLKNRWSIKTAGGFCPYHIEYEYKIYDLYPIKDGRIQYEPAKEAIEKEIKHFQKYIAEIEIDEKTLDSTVVEYHAILKAAETFKATRSPVTKAFMNFDRI